MAKKSKNRRNAGKTMVNVAKMLPTPVDAVKTVTDMTPVGDVKYGYDLATGKEEFNPLWAALTFVPYLGDGVKGVRRMVKHVPGQNGTKLFDPEDLRLYGEAKQRQIDWLENQAYTHKSYSPATQLAEIEERSKELKAFQEYINPSDPHYNAINDELTRLNNKKVSIELNNLDDFGKNYSEANDQIFHSYYDLDMLESATDPKRPYYNENYADLVNKNMERIKGTLYDEMYIAPEYYQPSDRGYIYALNKAAEESGMDMLEFLEDLRNRKSGRDDIIENLIDQIKYYNDEL